MINMSILRHVNILGSMRCFSSSGPQILRTGDILRQSRIFSDEDIIDYSKVSHDSNPLHFDAEVARNSGFEERLVHGMLVAALFPRIIASRFPGAIYVSQSLQFKWPVYVGDEVMGEVQAVNIRESKKKYMVKFSTKCFKSGELLVIDGEAIAILPSLALG
ncbi:3-hydroxyacyl-[acyl-carrier-protein] dehydratase, mitochondrial [Syzygium oleosum]|uniref:3-hydroxyacyl-[acyl-carrier-protein] dehydratase, mitochondrial n=1 Tax=Syzygium oleosum TaxID=219896 RepID=UPI0011D2A319|nr:3-hydroxyacyl-[acyl-carrier-protein] dehydratase, mitochondrial [Syzygium oleosum]